MGRNTNIDDLITFIRDSYNPEEKVKEVKDGKVTTFYRKAGKSLCYITRDAGDYVVTITIGARLLEKANAASLSTKTRERFDETELLHDGKWIQFTNPNKQEVEDIKELLQVKRRLKKSA